jgi:hypothetical protein
VLASQVEGIISGTKDSDLALDIPVKAGTLFFRAKLNHFPVGLLTFKPP